MLYQLSYLGAGAEHFYIGALGNDGGAVLLAACVLIKALGPVQGFHAEFRRGSIPTFRARQRPPQRRLVRRPVRHFQSGIFRRASG